MKLVRTDEEFWGFCRAAFSTDTIYLDLETTGFDPNTTKMLLGSFHMGGETYVVDFLNIDPAELRRIKAVLESESVRKVLHNAVFDWQHIFHHTGIHMRGVYCTMIAEQVIKAGVVVNAFGLDDVAYRRLSLPMDKAVRKQFIDRDLSVPFTEEEYEYSGKDAWALEKIYIQQQDDIRRWALEKVIDLECSIIPVTARMEYYGVCVDEEKMRAAIPVAEQIIRKADQVLQDLAISSGFADQIVFDGDRYYALNTSSNPQMLEFVRHFGVDVNSLSAKELTEWDANWQKRGVISAELAWLEETVDEGDDIHIGYEHPVLKKLAILKAASKVKGTYYEGLLTKINPVTKRLHPRFNQCGAGATGRFSSSNPK